MEIGQGMEQETTLLCSPGPVGACPSVLTEIRNHFCHSDTLSANLPSATAAWKPCHYDLCDIC